jgi:hypothetical protein
MTMPWGKFAGQPLHELPLGYLGWALEEAQSLNFELRKAIQDEIKRCLGVDDPPRWPLALVPGPETADAANELIVAGFRVVAMKAHPDRGGSHHAMLAATAARDWLRGAVERGVAA